MMKYEEPKIDIMYIEGNVFVTLSTQPDWKEEYDKPNEGGWLG